MLLSLSLLHKCFPGFLNCTNGAKLVQIDLDSAHTITPNGLLLYRLNRNQTELNFYHLVIEVHYSNNSIAKRNTRTFKLIGKENKQKGLVEIYLHFVESLLLVSSAIYLITGLVKELRSKRDKYLKFVIIILYRGPK